MSKILDIHTHKIPPVPSAVVNLSFPDCRALTDMACGDQLFSAGFHPWDTDHDRSNSWWDKLADLCSSPRIVAVGECGIDKLKGAPLFMQMNIFKKQIEISESLGKPLIIHCVRAHDIVIGLKKELNPRQNWLLHGFRGKPSVAKMLTDAGIFISFGPSHNDETVKSTPVEYILAETDDSDASISDVIQSLSALKNFDMEESISRNTERFLKTAGQPSHSDS